MQQLYKTNQKGNQARFVECTIKKSQEILVVLETFTWKSIIKKINFVKQKKNLKFKNKSHKCYTIRHDMRQLWDGVTIKHHSRKKRLGYNYIWQRYNRDISARDPLCGPSHSQSADPTVQGVANKWSCPQQTCPANPGKQNLSLVAPERQQIPVRLQALWPDSGAAQWESEPVPCLARMRWQPTGTLGKYFGFRTDQRATRLYGHQFHKRGISRLLV